MNTHSKRLAKTFSDLANKQRKALIPFITTGDPAKTSTVEIMHALVAGGADVIELGMPFSDPAADGKIIQQAGERAIAAGVGYRHSLDAVTAFRQTNQHTPVILMGYLNPAEVHPKGFKGFATAANEAGVDALILVDLSYESGAIYRRILREFNLDLIQLVAPTTSKTRLGKILKNAGGFVYYVSMRGTTGSAETTLDRDEIATAIERIREKSILPVCIGFGISNGETACAMARLADGIVVGSALVKKLYNAEQQGNNTLAVATDFMTELRQALDNDIE